MNPEAQNPRDKSELELSREVCSFFYAKYKALSDEEKKSHKDKVCRWFQKTLKQLPGLDLETLEKHWKDLSITAPNGAAFPAPQLAFDSWFMTPSSRLGLPATAATDGYGLITLDIKLLFAPREVVMGVLAHELAHNLFRAEKRTFAEKQSKTPEGLAEMYTPDSQAEEAAVADKLAEWKFRDDLVAKWEVSVEKGKENWRQIYDRFKDR